MPEFKVGDKIRNVEFPNDPDESVWEGEVVEVRKCPPPFTGDGYVYETHGRWVSGPIEEFAGNKITSRPLDSTCMTKI